MSRWWRATAIVLTAACVLLAGLIAQEMLVGSTQTDGSKPEKHGGSPTTVIDTTTAPQTPLCVALQNAQMVSLSRGGGDSAEVVAGLVAVMPEYLDAVREVLKEAENGGVPTDETAFLKDALDLSSVLLDEIHAADPGQVVSLIASSDFSEQILSSKTPTLYAIASGACKAGLGLRVQ